jgi:NADP-dependent 3-hydroxy acid dehydrogenase YdfG
MSAIVITGASSGIGLATAELFAKSNHTLLLISRRKITQLQSNSNVTFCQIDVTDANNFNKVINEFYEKNGKIDCLINNAGVMHLGSIMGQSEQKWDDMLKTNVLGVLNGVKAVLPYMINKDSGTIINISSSLSRMPATNHAVYGMTKAAVSSFSESIRQEVAKNNIRVIDILPGYVKTNLLNNKESPDILDDYSSFVDTLKKPLMPLDIANIIEFCFKSPPHVCIREIFVAPTSQIN